MNGHNYLVLAYAAGLALLLGYALALWAGARTLAARQRGWHRAPPP